MKRRDFVKLAAGGCGMAAAGRALAAGATAKKAPKMPTPKKTDDGLTWHNVQDWGVEGKGWDETERYFDRLPAKAKSMVRGPVWGLSRHSSGMCVRFETDATSISAKWTLLSKGLAMNHMPATGVSGLDLYAQDEQGRWRWVAIGRPVRQEMKARLVAGLRPGRRAYMLYLPLYNGTNSLEIGVSPKAAFQGLPPRTKPIVFYGTSIMQGGCASRPGMVHSAILGRRLDRATLNLGFSGNGRMDAELATLMAELDASAYVLDALPNMQATEVAQRADPFVHTLRNARPATPIVLVEDRTYQHAWLVPSARKRNDTSRAALRKAYDRLVAAGVKGLHYVEGEHLFGDDGEASVDGSHATDLGFMRQADALEPILRKLL